jgi:hypothetical protein
MKKVVWCAAILFTFVSLVSYGVIFQEDFHGKWKVKKTNGKIDLSMRIINKREFGDWHFSSSFHASDFLGFAWGKKGTFRMVREAGTLEFEGELSENSGSGSFIFRPDSAFVLFLEEKGFDGVQNKDLLNLCLNDISREYIDDLFTLGYGDISLSKLISFAIHDVSIDFIQGIHDIGFKNISPSDLISFCIHDVEPAYIQNLQGFGYTNLDPGELISFAIHDVTVDFVKDIHQLGYKDISSSELISFRIHDVDKKFIQRMNKKWEKKLSPSKIISLKIHEY